MTGAVGRLEEGQAALEKGQAALEKGQREIRAEMATKKELEAARKEARGRFDAVDARLDAQRKDVDANHAETRERFDELDEKFELVRGILSRRHERPSSGRRRDPQGDRTGEGPWHPEGSSLTGTSQGRATEQALRAPCSAASHAVRRCAEDWPVYRGVCCRMRFALDLPNAHGTTFVVKKIILKFVTPTIKKVGAALARLPPARPDIAELRRILKGTLGDERE